MKHPDDEKVTKLSNKSLRKIHPNKHVKSLMMSISTYLYSIINKFTAMFTISLKILKASRFLSQYFYFAQIIEVIALTLMLMSQHVTIITLELNWPSYSIWGKRSFDFSSASMHLSNSTAWSHLDPPILPHFAATSSAAFMYAGSLSAICWVMTRNKSWLKTPSVN